MMLIRFVLANHSSYHSSFDTSLPLKDGTISVDEFSSFLLSRNSEDRSQWLTVDHLTAPSPASKSSRRDARQHVGPDEHSANAAGVGLDYRERLFLQTVKSALIKDTLTRRNAGTISKADRLGHKTNSLVQKESSAHIENIFAPLTVSDGGGLRLVPLASFKRCFIVLNIFTLL